MELLRSAQHFLTGVLRRCGIWAPALLLDPFDLNDKLIQPVLPQDWKFALPWSPDWAPLVLFALVLWAAILTYHEVAAARWYDAVPNMTAQEVFAHILIRSKWAVSKSINGGQILHEVDLMIRDAARLNRVRIWGRNTGVMGRSASLEEIDPGYWFQAGFDFTTCCGDHESGGTAWHMAGDRRNEYSNIQFNKREVLAVWPTAKFPKWLGDKTVGERTLLFLRQI